MRRQTASIVKDLRLLTGDWDYHHPTPEQALRVKHLIDQLPAFRAAPQTKLENTLRSIEALLKDKTGFNPATESLTVSKLDQRLSYRHLTSLEMLHTIFTIVNIHHGVVPNIPVPEPDEDEGELVF